MAGNPVCKIEDCARPVVNGRGWCASHYKRWKRHGDPLAGGTPLGEPMRWLRSHARHEGEVDCLQWPFALTSGRPSVKFDGKTQIASRVMCAIAHGEPEMDGAHAAHSCGRGDQGCINPRHLRWATASENEADKVTHGTSNRGERHGLSKLSADKVREIRGLYGRMSQREASSVVGVSRWAVADIWNGKRWGWMK